MANLKEVLSKLMAAAGLDATANEEVKKVIDADGLEKVEVDTAISNILLNNLMNEEAAKNNPKLLSHFRATLLNGVDAKVKTIMEELELPEDVIAEVTAKEKTTQKLDVMREVVRKHFEKKGAVKKTQEEWENERSKLNNEIAQLKDQIPAIRKEEQSKTANLLKERDLNQMLYSYEYALDIPKDAIVTTAKALLNTTLSANKWQLEYNVEDSTNPFRLLNEQNLEAYQDNKPVSLKSVIEKVLADNKFLKVAAPAGQTQTSTTQSQQTQKQFIKGGSGDTTSIVNEYDEQIAKLTQ